MFKKILMNREFTDGMVSMFVAISLVYFFFPGRKVDGMATLSYAGFLVLYRVAYKIEEYIDSKKDDRAL